MAKLTHIDKLRTRMGLPIVALNGVGQFWEVTCARDYNGSPVSTNRPATRADTRCSQRAWRRQTHLDSPLRVKSE